MGRTFFEALPGVFETNVAILVWFENAAFHLQRHSKSTLGAISRASEKRPDRLDYSRSSTKNERSSGGDQNGSSQ